VLLSHLYFWTWNTQEVTNLIQWLRQYNAAHPTKQVGFYGFDMQTPGIAIDSVLSYVQRVGSPELRLAIAQDYESLKPYRNDDHGRFPTTGAYSAAGGSVWATTTPAVADVYAKLNANRAALVAASSNEEFSLALQMARVVVQWELSQRGAMTRDAAMAENTAWLLDREGAAGRLFLWAHNGHIARAATSMGGALAERFGTSYRPIGFGFASGDLNAVLLNTNGTFGGLRSHTAPVPVPGSYEEVFRYAKAKNFYFDLRNLPQSTIGNWLAGPLLFRSIGAVYSAASDRGFYGVTQLPTQFDVLIFVNATTASVLLPFKY
jgi:erythromycin esterase